MMSELYYNSLALPELEPTLALLPEDVLFFAQSSSRSPRVGDVRGNDVQVPEQRDVSRGVVRV